MKAWIWIGILLLAVLPAFGQDDDGGGDFDLFGGAEFGATDSGQRGTNQPAVPGPVDHINDILTKGGHALSEDQKVTLQALLAGQMETIRQAVAQAPGAPASGSPAGRTGSASAARPSGGPAPAGGQRSGPPGAGGRTAALSGGERRPPNPALLQQEEIYLAKVIPVLTPEQQGVWKKYQNDQIRARGGYPALKLALEEAGAAPSPEQETRLQEQFRTYSQQLRELRTAAPPGSQPDAVKLKELESQHLSALVTLLDTAQRKALLDWRRATQATQAQTPPRN